MAYINTQDGIFRPNFLDSEVGLITKTYTITRDMSEDIGGRKIVPAGTTYYIGDDAIGITYTDTDVTYGDTAGAVMVAGRVILERVTIPDLEAKTALEEKGIVFVSSNTSTDGSAIH